ncbi:MAG: hypothetical protein ACXVY3_08755 [Gaiellaceae bacterium]
MLTISRQRLLLECSRCRQAKLIDVALTDDGMLGMAKCDESKTDELRFAHAMRPRPRRPLRRHEPAAAVAATPEEPEEWISPGEVLRRVQVALGDFSNAR